MRKETRTGKLWRHWQQWGANTGDCSPEIPAAQSGGEALKHGGRAPGANEVREGRASSGWIEGVMDEGREM